MRDEESIFPFNLERLEAARYGIWGISQLSAKLEKLGSSVLLLLVNCVVIISYDWRYLMIPAVSFLLLIPLYHSVSRIELDNARRLLPENRAFGWYCKLISDFRIGEDLRIHQREKLITDRCGTLMDRIYSMSQKSYSKKGLYLGMMNFIFQFQIAAAAMILGYSFIERSLNIQDFVLLFSAVSAMSSAGNEIVAGCHQVKKSGTLLAPFFSFRENSLDLQEGKRPAHRKDIHSLAFENVSFSYPGSTKKALSNVSFSISAGEHVGIAGRNGAGKSTIAKLICRLYSPQEGRILLDGVDIRTIPDDEYRTYFAVLFQDFQ